MKAIQIIIVLLVISMGVSAQKSSMVIDMNYRTKVDESHLGIGAKYRYNLPYDFRLGANAVAYFPEDSNFGLDLGMNLQYVVRTNRLMALYPMVGFIVSNQSLSAEPNNRNLTDFGLSLGGGVEISLSKKGFVNIDYQYYFLSKDEPYWYRDYANISIGYGFRF